MELLREVLQRWMNHPRFDTELLLSTANLSSAISGKIAHFNLEGKTLNDLVDRRSLLDCAVNSSMDQENFRSLAPDELFAYASRLEEKYSADISQLKFFQDHINSTRGFYSVAEGAAYLFRHFDQQEQVMHYFESQPIPSVLETPLAAWMFDLSENAASYSPQELILASWFVHYSILIGMPNLKRNAVLARFAQGLFLKMHGMDASGLLSLSLGLLPEQSTFIRAAEKFRFKDIGDLPSCDLNNLLFLSLQAHHNALRDSNFALREVYHDHIEYEDMTPRQRNMVNFFFDEGWKLEKPDTQQLNERQQKIIELIYEHHFSSTKDLSLIFRCNRKTVQRDFTELLEMGLVRQMGNGAALRYTVNIKNRPHHRLEQLQNIRLSDAAVQISLFGNEPVNKESPLLQDKTGTH